MFAEFMENYGLSLVDAIATALVGFICIYFKRMIQRKLDTAEKRRIAKNVVLFVEQVYKGVGGEEKLNRAMEAAQEMLAESGITFNELEMRVLIESFLAQMNDVFGEVKTQLDDDAGGLTE